MNILNNISDSPQLLFAKCFGIGIFVLILSISILIIANGTFDTASFALLMSKKSNLITIQLIQIIAFFIIPPVLFAHFSKNDFLKLFNLDKSIQLKTYGFALLFAICLFPVITYFVYLIEQVPLPSGLKEMAEKQNGELEAMMKLFLDSPDLGNFLLMLLIVGFGAGLSEELFFRGLLMPLLGEYNGPIILGAIVSITLLVLFGASLFSVLPVLFISALAGYISTRMNNKQRLWSGIILSSLLFSALHLSIYNFIPITFIGILFAYLYSKTLNLKLNIFIHSLFNGLQVIINYLHQINILQVDINEVKTFPLFIVIPCLIICYYLFRKLIKSHEHFSS